MKPDDYDINRYKALYTGGHFETPADVYGDIYAEHLAPIRCQVDTCRSDAQVALMIQRRHGKKTKTREDREALKDLKAEMETAWTEILDLIGLLKTLEWEINETEEEETL